MSTTWDPTFGTNGQLLYSNGNRTVTTQGGDTNVFISTRSTTSHAAGKWYWEIQAPLAGMAIGNDWLAGVGDASAANNTYSGSTTHGLSADNQLSVSNIGIYQNGSNTTNFSWVISNNDVVAFAVDLGAALFWMQDLTSGSGWNAGGGASPGGSGGIDISAMSIASGVYIFASPATFYSTTGDVSFVLNPGPSGFTGSIPSGFSAWDAAPAAGVPYDPWPLWMPVLAQ